MVSSKNVDCKGNPSPNYPTVIDDGDDDDEDDIYDDIR